MQMQHNNQFNWLNFLEANESSFNFQLLEKSDTDWWFKCQYCGESLTDPTKKRAHIYLNSGMYVCYRRGEKRTFPDFLKEKHPDLYGQYLILTNSSDNCYRFDHSENKDKIENVDSGIKLVDYSSLSFVKIKPFLHDSVIEYLNKRKLSTDLFLFDNKSGKAVS